MALVKEFEVVMKRDEIREGIAKCLWEINLPDHLPSWEDLCASTGEQSRDEVHNTKVDADYILKHLHSKGVVIKVTCLNCQGGYIFFRTNKSKCPQCKGKGYTAVESLIEGEIV